MSTRYWQIGGFNPSIILNPGEYDQKKLANWIAGDTSRLRHRNGDSKDPVELILGIKPSGSSHLLMTDNQMKAIMNWPRERPRGQYTLAKDYDSLSPISFSTADSLANKLSYLRPKGGKNGDTSQANKGYSPDMRSDGVRASFEHCRLYYHIIHHSIDYNKFSLESQPWIRSHRVCAFTYNWPKNDTRPSKERIENPMILGLGFAEATIPDLAYKDASAVHITLARNKFLGIGESTVGQKKFTYGSTQDLRDAEIQACLQNLFKPSDESNKPMILLVFDQQRAINILKKSGVDVSTWQAGLRNLILDERSVQQVKKEEPGPSRHNNYDPRGRCNDYNDRKYRSRSRSRSPGRNNETKSYQSEKAESSRHQSAARTYAPVYVVDVQSLYVRMMQTQNHSKDIPSAAERILFRKNDGWCAGNEAPLLIDLWRSMIAGPPIDDQRALRESERVSQRPVIQHEPEPEPEPEPVLDPEDYDFDPYEQKLRYEAAKSLAKKDGGNQGGNQEAEAVDDYSDSDFGESD